MKKQTIYCIILWFTLLVVISSCKNNVAEPIQYEYVGCVGVKPTWIGRDYCIFYQYENMKYVLMSEFNYNAGNDTLLLSLDFQTYDYIITFGKKLTNIKYDKNYVKKNDHCEYIKDLKPLRAFYSDCEYEQLFIYKIYEKNKYRHLCP